MDEKHLLQDTPSPTTQLFILSLWFGLVYGLLEGILLLGLYQTHYLMWRNGVGPPILWVATVVDTALFLLAGCAMWVVFQVLGPGRERLSWALTFALFTWIAVVGLLSTSLAIQEWGCIIFALGATVQAFRWVRKKFRPERIAFFRRCLAPLLVVAIVAGVAGWVWPKWKEHRFLASLPPPVPGRPNVLLLVMDTTRADHMSVYGYPRNTTPNIAKLASQGMLFEKGFSAATNSPPAHLSMMSGVQPGDWYQGILHGKFNPMLAQVLAKQGYATVACVANNQWVIPQIGLAKGFSRFEVYFNNASDKIYRTFYGKLFIYMIRWWGGYYIQPGRKRAPDVNGEFLQWIDQARASGRPFFALLNYMDTHEPRFPPAPYPTKFSSQVTSQKLLGFYSWRCRIPGSDCNFKPNLTPADKQLIIDDYDGSLAYEDHWIGQLMKELERRGVLDNTLIILDGDHGESLGENGIWGHVLPTMREEISHVPFVLRYPPRIPADVRVPYPVSLLQIPATVVDVLGLPTSPFPGKSLLWNWQQPHGPVMVESMGNYELAYSNWHLIVMKDGSVQLYNLDKDPYEHSNLAGQPETALIEAEMRRQLSEMQEKAALSSVNLNPAR